jgi:predicted secreted protein
MNMMKNVLIACLCSFAVLYQLPAVMEYRDISWKDNGKTISVMRWEWIRIILPGNGTAGHSWEFTASSSILQYCPYSKSIPPNGGKFRFIFHAPSLGSCELLFKPSPSWDKSDQMEPFRVTILVDKDWPPGICRAA